MPPNSCFFGFPISAESAEIGKPFYFFEFPISAESAEIGNPNGFLVTVGVVVLLVGESCNWYCWSVLYRFIVLHLNFGVGGGNTMTN